MPVENFDDYVTVGEENLGVAIDLFVEDKSYIGALILAVTAYELFDRAMSKAGGKGILRWEFDSRQYIDPSAPAMSYANFKHLEQRERHAAVHGPENRGKPGPMQSAKEAAEIAIIRAQTNARVLERPRTAADKKFEAWTMERYAPFPQTYQVQEPGGADGEAGGPKKTGNRSRLNRSRKPGLS